MTLIDRVFRGSDDMYEIAVKSAAAMKTRLKMLYIVFFIVISLNDITHKNQAFLLPYGVFWPPLRLSIP